MHMSKLYSSPDPEPSLHSSEISASRPRGFNTARPGRFQKPKIPKNNTHSSCGTPLLRLWATAVAKGLASSHEVYFFIAVKFKISTAFPVSCRQDTKILTA